MNLILLLKLLLLAVVLGDECDINCSNIIEPVCGSVRERTGSNATERFQNICFFNRMKCRLKNDAYVQQIPDELCGIEREGRRVFDFSITGAHQACDHSCPTFCVDTYSPVCAFIHYKKNGAQKTEVRTMINHCHVDLFSCSVGVNVSIAGMHKCVKSQSVLFMSSVAGMKTLGFLDRIRRRSSLTLDSDVWSLKEYKSGGSFADVRFRHASVETRQKGHDQTGVAQRLGWMVVV